MCKNNIGNIANISRHTYTHILYMLPILLAIYTLQWVTHCLFFSQIWVNVAPIKWTLFCPTNNLTSLSLDMDDMTLWPEQPRQRYRTIQRCAFCVQRGLWGGVNAWSVSTVSKSVGMKKLQSRETFCGCLHHGSNHVEEKMEQ